MFGKATLRLAGLYLVIIIGISLFFSWNIYQQSETELDRGLGPRGARILIDRIPATEVPAGPFFDDFISGRAQLLDEAKHRVLNRLIVTNLIILVGGGALSYFLARRTLKPIEAAHQSLERFTADASHELRTPIAAMRAETEVALMDGKLTVAAARELLASNLEELEKLTALSDGLLQLARLDKQSLVLEHVSVASIVDQVVSELSKRAKQTNTRLDAKTSDALTVQVDPAAIGLALSTLVDNAIKYSPKGSTVKIRAKRDGDLIVISVRDQGPGIKPEDGIKVFERFYRGDVSRSNQEVAGHGLGLAIAKDIVALHGGRLGYRNAATGGTVFELQLRADS